MGGGENLRGWVSSKGNRYNLQWHSGCTVILSFKMALVLVLLCVQKLSDRWQMFINVCHIMSLGKFTLGVCVLGDSI